MNSNSEALRGGGASMMQKPIDVPLPQLVNDLWHSLMATQIPPSMATSNSPT